MQLSRGQRVPLAQLISANTFELRAVVRGDAREYDVACFMVGADGKLLSDDHVIFYNQTTSPDGAVRYASTQGANGPEASFAVDLSRLNPQVERLVLTVTPDGGELRGVARGEVSVGSAGRPAATHVFSGADFQQEKAIIALEIYRRNDEWRVNTVGQGFAGGLAALVTHFGGSVASQERPASPPPPAPPPAPATPPSRVDVSRPTPPAAPPTRVDVSRPAPPAGPAVSLTKVTLQKQGDSARISLTKQGQQVHVNLNWDQQQKRGFFGGGGSADLDLGCMIEMENGDRTVIQALGGNLGRRGQHPFIYVDKDDRSGRASDGENLYVERPELIRRVLIFTFIYEGTRSFKDVNGRMTLRDTAGNEVTVHLDNPRGNSVFCAVAMLERQGDQLVVRKEEQYFRDHQECDQRYGFNFQWKAGRK